MQKLGRYLLGVSAIIFGLVANSASAQEQTPWQTGSGGWVMKNLNWPGYNAGYEFSPEVDGEIVKLGGLFNGSKNVRLYDSAGNVLAHARVQGNNSWSYTDIEPVTVNAGESYTVAVETGWYGSSMSYGVGFPNFPLSVDDVTIKRAVFGFGTSKPRWELWGQMWGQPDLAFVPGGSISLPVEPVVVTAEFPSSPIYVDAMPSTSGPQPTYADVYLNIQNVSSMPLVFNFTSSQWFDILLLDMNGNVVTSWSADKTFLTMISSKTLFPGETLRVGDALAIDQNVPPGDYLLRIELTGVIEGYEDMASITAQQPVTVEWAY